ncbi:MAG: hypothetical protein Q8N18_26330 [Opitutaceae bacterium]|nr:hypothetical protein [Opitutaceae bacterium]
MKAIHCITFAVVGAAGCASYNIPSQVGGVRLAGISSSAVEVYRPRFVLNEGTLALEAYAMREFKGQTSPDSHIDIVYLDGTGRKVAEERANVRPHNLPGSGRMPRPHAYFKQAINLPAGTASVEVRAHEEPHGN